MEHATAGDDEPTLVSAIQVLVDRHRRGQGLSAVILGEMRRITSEAGFGDLVAPVRPSGKSAYSLTPMERFAAWTTEAGLPSIRGCGCMLAQKPASSRSARARW